MEKRVEIIEQRDIFNKAVFRIIEARLKYERYDGMLSGEIVRLNLDRGDSVAALVHDTETDAVVLTEQFRYPTQEKGPGWIIEIPAGMVGKKESPPDTVARELFEEVGYVAGSLKPIGTFYVSPGGSSERIHLYYVMVNRFGRTGNGGGMADEGEDIRVIRYPVSDALDDLLQGKIQDAKTIIALQWLALHRDSITKPS